MEQSQGLGSLDDGSQPLAFSFMPFTPGQAQAPGEAVVRTFAHFPVTWLFGSWEVPACLGLEYCRPRQVHKLSFPPPLSFWGQAGSLRPRGRAGPPGGAPPSRLHPPGEGPRGL